MSARIRLITAATLIAGIALQRGGLILIALLIAVVDGLAVFWRRRCLDGVAYERVFSTTRIFFGETVDLRIRVENRKLLPVPWLVTIDEVPDALTFQPEGTTASGMPNRALLTNAFSLRPYERITKHYQAQCNRRGHHAFGPVRLRSGDLFGLTVHEGTVNRIDSLLVYPKIVPLRTLDLPAAGLFGEQDAAQRRIEDAAATIGARAYVAGDPLRRIHWTATARTGTLQSRVYDYTAHRTVAIFLDINTAEHTYEEIDAALVELAITTTASLVAWACAERYRIGCYSNAHRSTGEARIVLPPTHRPTQAHHILEALASVIPISLVPIEKLLQEGVPHLPSGTCLLLVTGRMTDPLAATLLHLQAMGHTVTVIAYGRNAPGRIAEYLPIYQVGGAEVWDELVALDLAR